jgi:PAS domain S-box-containing protein
VHQIELEMQNMELRLAYAELDAVRASYFDLYNVAPVGYFTISEKGLILEANLTAATLLGLARSAMIKQPISRFIHKEDQDIYYLQRKQLFETDEPQDWDMRMVKKDGTVFWAHLKSTVAMDAEGKTVCHIVMSDITKSKRADMLLRESEQNFRTLADSGRALIWTSGTDKLCNYFNSVWLEFTGRKLEQEMGNGWTEGVHPDDLQSCLDIYVGAFDRREKFSMEYRMLRYDGEYRWILDDGCPRYDSMGEFIGYIGHCLDISERKHDEEENAKLEVQLRHAQKMESIGFLAGGIAHDLNNILFPISGLSEMLLDDVPPGNPEHESIKQIYKSAQRGSDLVKQILTFSRQSKPQKLPIKIQSILKDVLRLVRSTIPMNIEITSHIKPDCGMVSADPTQVHQIVMNLITNAYHAVERNGGTIDIELKETGPPDVTSGYFVRLLAGGYARITVSDTGTGIDKTLIDKIFDPYFTTKELGKGTGLGLSVVYGIVKEHSGDIQVYSEVGRGTTFHVYLPLLIDAKYSKSAAVTREYPTGRERILLVDDEEPIVRMEQMMLERLGYQVTARTSSLDALAAFKANPGYFDLVISDRGMPLMTGEQLARKLIFIKPGIPIIICTGFGDENDVNRAKAMGIKGFLMKPVATGDLATMVRKVLDDSANKPNNHTR